MIALLVQLTVFLVVTGLIWWLLTTLLPLPDPVKKAITVVFTVVVGLVTCVSLLQFLGVDLGFNHLGTIPRLR